VRRVRRAVDAWREVADEPLVVSVSVYIRAGGRLPFERSGWTCESFDGFTEALDVWGVVCVLDAGMRWLRVERTLLPVENGGLSTLAMARLHGSLSPESGIESAIVGVREVEGELVSVFHFGEHLFRFWGWSTSTSESPVRARFLVTLIHGSMGMEERKVLRPCKKL